MIERLVQNAAYEIGMDPAEHYLRFGAAVRRDPGPQFSTGFFIDSHPEGWQKNTNPLLQFVGKNAAILAPEERSILWAAQNVALRGQPERAVQLAADNLPPHLAYTTNILRANVALLNGSEEGWIHHVNAYLEKFTIVPLIVDGSGTLFERLSTEPVRPVTGGPLVSVIMPAWNAEKTVGMAARSILAQSWQNFELLIVDDCSEDSTWTKLQEIAARDKRVRIMRNKVNVGPYVSKNIALQEAKGEWITGHDADDWAHPQRLEKHFANGSGACASLTYMLRMRPNGYFEHFTKIGKYSSDGVARIASISCLFERDFLKNKLGYWDSVRYGADSEMIERARTVLGTEFLYISQIGMICLDMESSLTNHPENGIKTPNGLSDIRKNYKNAWSDLHRTMVMNNCYLEFLQSPRKYATHPTHEVPLETILDLREDTNTD